jgi:enolase-phosphatase E1
VLTDIEGTTTSLAFVKDVLFPHSTRELPAFVRAHRADPEVLAQLAEVCKTAREEGTPLAVEDLDGIGRQLLAWIKEDRKHGALKWLQGRLWKQGYESGAYLGHVYPDVPVELRRWREAGTRVAVYSSGSVEAQQLLFRHSEAGDLSPLFDAWFDTSLGSKRDPAAYERILEKLEAPPGQVLFLSDAEEELDAARVARLRTLQLIRPAGSSDRIPVASRRHPAALTFSEVSRHVLL